MIEARDLTKIYGGKAAICCPPGRASSPMHLDGVRPGRRRYLLERRDA